MTKRQRETAIQDRERSLQAVRRSLARYHQELREARRCAELAQSRARQLTQELQILKAGGSLPVDPGPWPVPAGEAVPTQEESPR
jgi:hypothetical protein